MHQINPVEYDRLLHLKIDNLEKVFSYISLPAFEVYKSEPLNFRMRAEFRIWHEDGEVFYAMNNPDKKTPYIINEFPIGSKKINELMAPLLLEINKNYILKNKLIIALI